MWLPRLPSALRARSRRGLESSVFIVTFCAALATVSLSASTLLPCPANGRGGLSERIGANARGAFAEEDEESKLERASLPAGGRGQRAHLTKQGGWLEISDRPSIFSPRRWVG